LVFGIDVIDGYEPNVETLRKLLPRSIPARQFKPLIASSIHLIDDNAPLVYTSLLRGLRAGCCASHTRYFVTFSSEMNPTDICDRDWHSSLIT
jgi:hypothetical protein